MKRGLIIAAVLVLLGFGGLFAYTQNKSDDDGKKNSQGQNASQSNPDDPSEGGKYLVIKEWGVRFPKTDKTQDLIYYINPENPDGIINFGLNSLAMKYPSCSPEKVGLSIGIARRKNVNDFYPLESFVKIEDYFYAIGGGGASCFESPNAPLADTELSGLARGELSKALQKIEKAN